MNARIRFDGIVAAVTFDERVQRGKRGGRSLRPSPPTIPLVRSARGGALLASAALGVVGLLAGSVRVLPWLLDPDVPWRVAAPFARGLAEVALEGAIVVGWPLGWALACVGAVESREAIVLQTLGEPPATTTGRLAPQAMWLAAALCGVAAVAGSDAAAPGRMATEMVREGRGSCTRARAPIAYIVPFTGLAWLCAPGRSPRFAGVVPAAMGRTLLTAADARITGDFRTIELDDARLALPGETPVSVHAGGLTMRGMAPWARASTLPPALRAVLLAFSAWIAGSVAAYGVLRLAVRARVTGIVLGAIGPLAALGSLRMLERADAPPLAYCVVPLVAGTSAALALALLAALQAAWVRRRAGSRQTPPPRMAHPTV